MSKQTLLRLSLLLILVLSRNGFAEVKYETGAFVISYIDIAYTGGLEPRIERTYNSTSSFRGMFGLGWGGNYETYLTVTGHGPIVRHDLDRGEDYRFVPKVGPVGKPAEIAELMVPPASKIRNVNDPTEANFLSSQQLQGPYAFDQFRETYADKGLVAFKDPPLRSVWRGERFGYQEIERVADGYEYRNGFGQVEKYNDDGKLVSISDSNGNKILLSLDARGKIVALQDNFGRKIVFTYNSHNLVEKITGTSPGSRERVATYKYNDRDEMIWSNDWNNVAYGHEYAAKKMTKITYPEKTTREMTYYGQESEGKVKTVKDPEGRTNSYSYLIDKTDGHLTVDETIRTANTKSVVTNKYVYFYKNKPSGERWNWRAVETSAGATSTTDYAEGCGCPTMIIDSSKSTATFSYDELGRVFKKVTTTETTELTYLGNTGRVLTAKKTQKPGSPRQTARVTTAMFRYDEITGNLKSASMTDGVTRKWFLVEHDEHGRIKELRDSTGRIITFAYNNSSKPTRISVWGHGEIYVTYENDGETIKDVEGKDTQGKGGARDPAMQVTAAFDLLTVITSVGKVTFSS